MKLENINNIDSVLKAYMEVAQTNYHKVRAKMNDKYGDWEWRKKMTDDERTEYERTWNEYSGVKDAYDDFHNHEWR